jgi:hypothetical protein
MIYIEYIERDRFMDVDIFRLLGDQTWWSGADDDADDELVAQLGRTLRIGPHPSYMAIWRCRGFNKMDQWENYFQSDEALRNRQGIASHKAIHFVAAGCYDEIFTGPAIGDGLQYIEYFKPGAQIGDEDTAKFFTGRSEKESQGELNLVLRRIGLLGPDPRGIAIWTFPNFTAIERIAREDLSGEIINPVSVGIYRPWGKEIL